MLYGHGTNSPLLIIKHKIQITTCLVLFACKELLNDWFQLGTKVFAVEPAFEKNLGAAVNKIPEDHTGNDENENNSHNDDCNDGNGNCDDV